MTNVRKQSENARNLSRNQSVSGRLCEEYPKSQKNFMNFLLFLKKFFVPALILDIIFRKSLLCFFFIFFLILKLPQTIDRFFMIFLCFQGSKWALLLLDLLLKKIKKQLPPVVLKNSYFFHFFHVFCKKVIFFSIQGGQLLKKVEKRVQILKFGDSQKWKKIDF